LRTHHDWGGGSLTGTGAVERQRLHPGRELSWAIPPFNLTILTVAAKLRGIRRLVSHLPSPVVLPLEPQGWGPPGLRLRFISGRAGAAPNLRSRTQRRTAGHARPGSGAGPDHGSRSLAMRISGPALCLKPTAPHPGFGVDCGPDLHLRRDEPHHAALHSRICVVVFLLGDTTARIGDPTGHSATSRRSPGTDRTERADASCHR